MFAYVGLALSAAAPLNEYDDRPRSSPSTSALFLFSAVIHCAKLPNSNSDPNPNPSNPE